MIRILEKALQKLNKIFLVSRNICLNIAYSWKVAKLNSGDYFINENIPYECQFATPELVADILDKKVSAKDDPNWKIFGYKNQNEYAFWSWRICGIACLKMIFDYYDVNDGKSMADLTRECVELGGYDIKKDHGWFFKPLLAQIKKHKLNGFIGTHFGVNLISDLILNKKFFIASVNPSMVRFDKDFTNKKPGGHLAIVIGFRIKNKKIEGFFLNNPSGKSSETRRKAFVPINIFAKAYSKKGIAIWK